MGGYSNWSAEQNAAYALATGTQNIGAGKGWKVAELTLAGKTGSTPTTAQVNATLAKSQEGASTYLPTGQAAQIVIKQQAAAATQAGLPESYEAKTYTPRGVDVMFGSYVNPQTGVTEGREFRIEGTYKKIGTYSATQDGVTTPGTLWRSDKGFYQFVDPSGQTIMSGSTGAPLPKLEKLSEKEVKDISTWKQWNTGIPTSKITEEAAAATVQPTTQKTIKKLSGGADYTGEYVGGYTGTEEIPSTQKEKVITGVISAYPAASKKESAVVSTGEISAYPFSTTQPQKALPTTKSGTSWLDSLTGNVSKISITPPYKHIGEYDLYPDGTVTYHGTNTSVNVSAIGGFGMKRNMRHKRNKECPCKKQGFMGMLHQIKEETEKQKPKKKPSIRDAMWSGISYSGDKKTVPRKIDTSGKSIVKPQTVKMPSVTKPVKKEKYGSAWEQILFSKPKKKTGKK